MKKLSVVTAAAVLAASFATIAVAGPCEQLQGKRFFASVTSTPGFQQPANARVPAYFGTYYFDFSTTVAEGSRAKNGTLWYTWYGNSTAPLRHAGDADILGIGLCRTAVRDKTIAEIYGQFQGEEATEGTAYLWIKVAPDGKSYRLGVANSLFAVNEVTLNLLAAPAEVHYDASGKAVDRVN